MPIADWGDMPEPREVGQHFPYEEVFAMCRDGEKPFLHPVETSSKASHMKRLVKRMVEEGKLPKTAVAESTLTEPGHWTVSFYHSDQKPDPTKKKRKKRARSPRRRRH